MKNVEKYFKEEKWINYWYDYIKKKGYYMDNDKIIFGRSIGKTCNEDNDCFSRYCKKDKEGNYCFPNND